MSSPKRTKLQVRQLAEAVVKRLREDHDDEVLGVVRQVLAEKVKKPSGRPVEDDWEVYKEMAKRLASGEAATVSDAARQLAHRIADVAESTALGRLRNKYPELKEALEAELAAETSLTASIDSDHQDPIIEGAFEEDVKPWDL